MSDTVKLGQLIEGQKQRDAIHVAIAPVVAGEVLIPGQHVGLAEESTRRVWGRSPDPIGIIDPFLTDTVRIGQWCYLLLYPNTVTGMRHEWQHPAFGRTESTEGGREESEMWLRTFAEKAGLSFGRMMEIVEDYVETGEVWVEQGSERSRNAYYDAQSEFWVHYKNVTGVDRPDHAWPAPFSCSC